MRITDEMIAQDDERYRNRDVLTELKFCGKDMNERRHTTVDNLRFYAWLFRQAAEIIESQKKTIDCMRNSSRALCGKPSVEQDAAEAGKDPKED